MSEIKGKVSETKRSALQSRQALDPSQQLPTGPWYNALSFLSVRDLAGSVSSTAKNLLANANEPRAEDFKEDGTEQRIEFSSSRQIHLNTTFTTELQNKLVTTSLAFTGTLQNPLFTRAHQINYPLPALFRTLFSHILAGRITEKETIDELQNILRLPDENSFTATSLLNLTKIWIDEDLLAWQKEALRQGFTLEDLCSEWISEEHVVTVKLEEGRRWTPAMLRGLKKYQVMGIRDGGFTSEEVTAVWFSPLLVEAILGGYGLDAAFIRNRQQQLAFENITPEVLSARLKNEIFGEIINGLFEEQLDLPDTPEDWRAFMITPIENGPTAGFTPLYLLAWRDRFGATLRVLQEIAAYSEAEWQENMNTSMGVDDGNGQYTPLYIAISAGHIDTVTAIKEIGGYTPPQRQEEMKVIAQAGAGAGRTPFFVAAANKHLAILRAIKEWGHYTDAQWQNVMGTPLEEGVSVGLTPFFATVTTANAETLKAIKELGGYTRERWKAAINTPLETGDRAGIAPLVSIMFKGEVDILSAIKKIGGYTDEEWQNVINTPLEEGVYAGKTLLYLAAFYGRINSLTALKALGGYQKEQWWEMMKTPMLTGNSKGKTPLSIAVSKGYIDILRAMRESCTEEQWRDAMDTPLRKGDDAGSTPIYLAAVSGSADVLIVINELGAYTQIEWQKIMNTPMASIAPVISSSLGSTPFMVASEYPQTLRAIKKLGGYKPEQWKLIMNTRMEKGLYKGRAPLSLVKQVGCRDEDLIVTDDKNEAKASVSGNGVASFFATVADRQVVGSEAQPSASLDGDVIHLEPPAPTDEASFS